MSGISGGICDAYKPVMEQMVFLAMEGHPLSIAKSLIESLQYTDVRLWGILTVSIESAYENPQKMMDMLQNNSWVALCLYAITSG